MQKITTFLMFEGKAEEAMSFYMSLFPDSEIKSITRYAEGEAGAAGSVQHAVFSLSGQQFTGTETQKHSSKPSLSSSYWLNRIVEWWMTTYARIRRADLLNAFSIEFEKINARTSNRS